MANIEPHTHTLPIYDDEKTIISILRYLVTQIIKVEIVDDSFSYLSLIALYTVLHRFIWLGDFVYGKVTTL
jgi:hypothetical protein